MPLYYCKIGSADGRIIEKEFEAANSVVLKQTLEEQGFFVFSVKKKPFQFLWETGAKRRRVDNKELLTFNQELLVLMKAGLPIIQVLDTILERGGKGKLIEVLVTVREEIKGGAALSDAMAKHPGAFSHLYVASVRAGERTGDLPLTIKRYTAFIKKAEAIKKKVISALMYPAILLTVASAAILLLLVYVVPSFSQVYADAGSQLPAPTQALISFTSWLKRYFLFIVVLSGFGIALFRRWGATHSGRYIIDGYKVKLPIFGDLHVKYSLTGFTRTLGTVIGSGIPIVESLKMSVGTLNNRVLERRLLDAVAKVEEGVSLSSAFEGAKIMPPIALRMIGVGETTGALEEMLSDISEYLEEEIEARLHILTTAIEPAIMIIMGVIIGVIILTMYLPIFKIAGTVGG
ncbi:type II secretion system protein F [Geobacter sp. OR-1]|uniref:type II secretion system F family protein n=1 Tax=Geobacter sp. OR-1 TaxID=1266765 RepID=UPI000543CB87|nr:type II secretion system F family protein [Geobacter sp. OR-1]GAM10655.1 type II secretion system protein F [Geobacter sp. OR-1]